VAQEDGTEAVWRCPVHGWNIRFDDLTLPWWRWQAIEKMHIEPRPGDWGPFWEPIYEFCFARFHQMVS